MLSPRLFAFLVAALTPVLAYRLGGTALWTLNAAGLTIAAALAAFVLWQDELLRDVLVPRSGDAAWGIGLSAIFYFILVLVFNRIIAPSEQYGGLLRVCDADGSLLFRRDDQGIVSLLDSVRAQVCRGWVRTLAIQGPLRGVLVVFIAMLEELAWRGGVQQALSEKLGSSRGWLAASLLYAGAHAATGNWALALVALLGGLLWGGLYRYRGRLAPGMLGHAVFSYFLFFSQPLVVVR